MHIADLSGHFGSTSELTFCQTIKLSSLYRVILINKILTCFVVLIVYSLLMLVEYIC